jgi:hypothetical protein
MPETVKSIGAWFKEKTTSPLYGVFIACLLFWNWRIIYTLFWQDMGIITIPTIEYIQRNLLFIQPDEGLLNILINKGWMLVPPVIFTYLIIRWLPPVHEWAHRIHVKNYFSRKIVFFEEKLKYQQLKLKHEESKKGILKSLVGIKQEQVESEKQIQKSEKEIEKSLSNQDRWEIEFSEFIKTANATKFKETLDLIYRYDGQLQNQYGEKNSSSASLAVADSHGLISLDSKTARLTEKGKFFAKKFLDRGMYLG